MQEQSYEFDITLKILFEINLINTFLRKKRYILWYLIFKIIPILNLFVFQYLSTTYIILSIVMFFFYDLVILYIYFSCRKIFKNIFKDHPKSTIKLKEEEIEVINYSSTTVIKWEEVTRIKESKWMIRLFKNGLQLLLFYKRVMPKDTMDMVLNYVYKQREKYSIKI